jgi:hypothetical protein
MVAWCIGSEAAARARERGWPVIRELAETVDDRELVARIAGNAYG